MNSNNSLTAIARITSIVFHPFLIPTIGFLLLFNSGFYFAILPWNVKKYMLLVVFLSTCVLPALSIGVLALSQKFDLKMGRSTDRVLPLILSSIYYYLGYLILLRLPVFPIYNLFLIASILIQIGLLVVSLKWKISAHTAAIGGLVGGLFGLSFRLQENPVLILAMFVLVAGMVGTARLILAKHTSWQVYAGFLLGFLVMNLSIWYI
ncbi:MAG: phosphatase PAP2 family protein [Bacteroidota bacterium]|nr:phosphatase PAP2 family protein [Bacteroidota bacterium]